MALKVLGTLEIGQTLVNMLKVLKGHLICLKNIFTLQSLISNKKNSMKRNNKLIKPKEYLILN